MTQEIRVERIPISAIKENPLNREIFNEVPEDKYEALKEYIRKSGLLKPLIINGENVLLAGHARLKICRELGHETVPVQRMEFTDAKREEEFLIKDNLLTRLLSPVEITKAGMHLEHITKKWQRNGEPLRDLVAKTLGISPAQYVKMKAIIASDDQDLIKKVDRAEMSVAKAYALLKQERDREKLQKLAAGEKPRFRLINEDAMAALSNFKPGSCDVVVAEPPEGYNSVWVDLTYRALKETGSLFILTQRNFKAISEAFSMEFRLVAPIAVIGKTHQEGQFVYNHRNLVWLSKGSRYKGDGPEKISTVWDFRQAPDPTTEIFARIISLTTAEAGIVVHLFGDNRSILGLGEATKRNIFAIQPDKDQFVREKLRV